MNTLFPGPQTLASPRYVSHRGFTPLAPENSLPGFEYAGRLSQWAIETDLRLTRDGRVVCCHNARVDERFDGAGEIAQMEWAELSRLRMKDGARLECFDPGALRIPLCSEYLAICKRYGSVPFIELKTGDVEAVAREIERSGLPQEGVVISSVNMDWLLDARRVMPRAFVHWIFARQERLSELAGLGNAGLSWNLPDPFAPGVPEAVRLAREAGLRVCLRAGDSLASVAHMLRLGLDYIPTNRMHAAL